MSDVDKLQPQLVQLNRSGKIINTFDLDKNISGLAFDGEKLWAVCETLESEVFYTVQLNTGELIQEFSVPSVGYDTEDLAVSGDRLWLLVSEEAGRCIYEIDITSRSISNKIELPYLMPGGMTYADDSLWVGDPGIRKGQILRINPISGEVVKKYSVTRGFIVGLTTDGKDVFIAETDGNTIYVLEK